MGRRLTIEWNSKTWPVRAEVPSGMGAELIETFIKVQTAVIVMVIRHNVAVSIDSPLQPKFERG